MSSLINKAKDILSSNKGENPQSTNAGPHSSNVGNKVDPMVDSDLDGRGVRTTGPGHTHTGYGASTTADTSAGYGTGYGTGHGVGTTGTHSTSTNVGPHSSNLANKLDPRVDSDADHRNDPTSTMGSSQSGYGSSTTGTYSGSTNAGPHNSNLANKFDPRVDSDMDGRNTGTGYSAGTTTGTGYGHTSSGITGGTHTSHGTHATTTAGPHSSNLMNKADPRVDSDRDHRNDPTSRVGGYGTQSTDTYGTTTGTAGTGYGTGYGTGAGAVGTGNYDSYGSSNTPGSGNAASTAGPHNSNLLNKLDPRVDSDLDGSKTYGGNQTHR